MIEIKLDAAGSLDLLVALSEALFCDTELSTSSYEELTNLHSVLSDKILSCMDRGVDNPDA